MTAAPIAHAQAPETAGAEKDRQIVVFTIDVAEDLAGKFVPTFVKPEDTQPEGGRSSGNYAGFVGEQRQTFLGFNSTGGVNLRVTFVLRPVVR